MARTITVTDETHRLLGEMIRDTYPPESRIELVARIVRQHAVGTGTMPPRATLPMERPANLTEREWRVLVLRCEGCASLERAGKILGVTRERIRQIEEKALRKHPEFRNGT